MTLYIKSPKATKVKSVGTPLEAKVQKGDLLFELFDYEEQKVLSHINFAIEENSEKKLEAQGPFVQSKIQTLASVVDYRQDAIRASQAAYGELVERYRVGQTTSVDVIKARQDVALRTYMLLQSGIEAELYSRNAEDSLKVFDNVDIILKKEKEYVERITSRLRILAPARGTFKRYVQVDTPVRLGHLLGEIA
jgi:hypothetical protein